MTKKQTALQLLGLALDVHRAMAGDETADIWIVRLLWLAQGLNPAIVQHPRYLEVLSDGDSLRMKLRRLIEHPETPAGEREAAVAALARVRVAG